MKNLVASISARLKNESRATGRAINLVIEDYANSRLFARLSASRYADTFILKGAQLFKLWAETPHRPTRDAGFFSFSEASVESLETIFRELSQQETEPADGLEWRVEQAAPIREDNLYGGVRVKLTARLGNMRIPAQIDVGFGDAITPEAEQVRWPMPLDFPSVSMRAYRPETAIAEKLHAAVVLEASNSRMKDFFDLHWLAAHQSFLSDALRDAIEATFARRDTEWPSRAPLALTRDSSTRSDKQLQWKAFLRKSRLPHLEFEEVIQRIADFLLPVMNGEIHSGHWTPESGWTSEVS